MYQRIGIEEQAIIRLRRGDLSGLEELIKRYQVKAVHAAWLIVQDKATAEDIVQNSFIALVGKIHQYDPERPFSPWFFRTVINDSIKAAQRDKRLTSLADIEYQSEHFLERFLANPEPQPEDLVVQQEINDMVWQAINRLPPEQKAAIVMRHFLDMSEKEIETQLRRPKTTIKYWLRTARERLGRLLHAYSTVQTSEREPSRLGRDKGKKGAWYER